LLNNVFDVVVESAKTMNASMRLSGTIEVDGTSIRTIRVGFRSRTFQHLVNQWKATHIFNERRPPKYFLLHARFLGAVERGKSHLVLAPAPFKLYSFCWSKATDRKLGRHLFYQVAAASPNRVETVSQPNFDGRWCKSMEWSCTC
jgi:hypothetical protein